MVLSPGSSLVISVSEARETIVNLDEVGRLLTYGGNNYDFVSIRVVGTLKDEFKKPAVPVDDKLPEELDEELEEEVPATTEDIAWLDEEIDVLSTTPDAGALVPTAVLAPTVEYTSDFTYQPEYDYEIELIYSKDEPKPEPKRSLSLIRNRMMMMMTMTTRPPPSTILLFRWHPLPTTWSPFWTRICL